MKTTINVKAAIIKCSKTKKYIVIVIVNILAKIVITKKYSKKQDMFSVFYKIFCVKLYSLLLKYSINSHC